MYCMHKLAGTNKVLQPSPEDPNWFESSLGCKGLPDGDGGGMSHSRQKEMMDRATRPCSVTTWRSQQRAQFTAAVLSSMSWQCTVADRLKGGICSLFTHSVLSTISQMSGVSTSVLMSTPTLWLVLHRWLTIKTCKHTVMTHSILHAFIFMYVSIVLHIPKLAGQILWDWFGQWKVMSMSTILTWPSVVSLWRITDCRQHC